MKFSKHAFIFLFFVIFSLAPVAVFAIEAGTQAPDFRLTSVAGEEVSLTDYKGRLVLLKLATTWCPTCQQLSAEIGKLGEFLKEKNAVVLEVFVQDTQQAVESYLGDAEPAMTFHALLDDGQVYDAYGVYLIPRFLIVDAQQVVRYDSAGSHLMAEDIRAMVEAYSLPAAEQGST